MDKLRPRAARRSAALLPDGFPIGMKVLVVDDDKTNLETAMKMLREYKYEVTACSRATEALSLLQEDKTRFDIVLTDVHIPDMDGLKLLKLIGVETDLPVILTSNDVDTNMVMKGIKNGACHILPKPLNMEVLRNLWQHVIRRKLNGKENSGGFEDHGDSRPITDDEEDGFSENDVSEASESTVKPQTKEKGINANDDIEINDKIPPSKKARLVWSPELHDQFVDAVKQLGEEATPKKILELMDNPCLTRANVASHWQKYKSYLRKLNEADQQQGLPYYEEIEPDMNMGQLQLDSSPFMTFKQVPMKMYGSATGSQILGQPSAQCLRQILVEREMSFGHPLINYETNISQQVQSSQNSSILAQMVQKQQIQYYHSEINHAFMRDVYEIPQQSNNFQAEINPHSMNQNAMVVPYQTPSNFQVGNTSVLQETISNYSVSPISNISAFPSSSYVPLDMG